MSKLFTLTCATAFFVSSSVPVFAIVETNYSAQNFNTNAGYVRGFSSISTNQPANIRWQGNDPYDGTNGETDVIQRATGYTPSPIANSSLIQGGADVANGIFPATNNVSIWKSFTPSLLDSNATVSFFAEWSVIPSLEGAPYNLLDTFSFDLRNAANTQSLLTLQFTPGINILPNSYTLQTIAAGSPTNTPIDLGYQSLFQIQVDMTGSTYDLSLAQINPATRALVTNYPSLTTGSLSTGFTALDFATVQLNWELASGNNLEPGSNYLIANQFLVTSSGTPIPEPGTWASALLLGLAAFFVARHHRRGPAAGN
jgi:hypothetical protein